jgi:hypothetical protein
MAHLRRHPLIAAAAMILTAAAVSLITGCAADQTAPEAPTSQFQATVSGAIQAPLQGSAVVFALPPATVDSTQVPPSSILGMADKNTQTVVAFKWQNTLTPTPGSYAVGTDTSSVAMMYDQGTGAPGTTFNGTGGTVTVTSASAESVSGSYSVTATADDTGAQITVTGTFTAPIQAGPAN